MSYVQRKMILREGTTGTGSVSRLMPIAGSAGRSRWTGMLATCSGGAGCCGHVRSWGWGWTCVRFVGFPFLSTALTPLLTAENNPQRTRSVLPMIPQTKMRRRRGDMLPPFHDSALQDRLEAEPAKYEAE